MSTTSAFRNVIHFDQNLAVGQKVEARWTANFNEYAAAAEIVKLNEKSVRVKLIEEVETGHGGKYPVGHVLSIPRLLAFKQHTIKNCVSSLEGEKGGPKFKRGEIIEGRGKVVSIYYAQLGYEYRCEGESHPT